jgi:hypothetical protein
VLRQFANGAALASPRELAALPIVVLGDDIPDLASMAVPIFGLGGKTLGALSVSGPVSRFDRPAMAKIKLLLREMAISLTDRLGGDSDVFRTRRTSREMETTAGRLKVRC